jgi:AcrR family transcriptional regulator
MPKAFNENEKFEIRKRLMAAGRECFSRWGLKKTTVEDLVRPAGIAKGSFYLFFESKEALYIEIMFEEIPGMMDRLIKASFESTPDIREGIVRFQRALVAEIETNAMSRIVLEDPQELARLLAQIDSEDLLARAAGLYARFTTILQAGQKRGEIIAGDPQELAQMLAMIKILPLYREKIGQEAYPGLVKRMSEVIADGLTCPARTKKEGR